MNRILVTIVMVFFAFLLGCESTTNKSPQQVDIEHAKKALLPYLCDGPLQFADANIEAAVRAGIDIPTGDIYSSDVQNLKELEVVDMGVQNINGIQCLSALEKLKLQNNEIFDISYLQGLVNLDMVLLHNNNITNFDALLNNPGIDANDKIHITGNDIYCDLGDSNSDADALEARGVKITYKCVSLPNCKGALTFPDLALDNAVRTTLGIPVGTDIRYDDVAELTSLNVDGYGITDLTGINCLDAIQDLNLANNNISTMTPLFALENIVNLNLFGNQLLNIQPLLDMPGIGMGDSVDVSENPFDCDMQEGYLFELDAKGVSVSDGCGCDEGAMLCDGNILNTCINEEWVLQDCSQSGDVCGQISSDGTLACALQECVGPIVFADSNLEQVVRDTVGIPTGDMWYTDFSGITSLWAGFMNVSDIDGVQCMYDLNFIDFYYGQVSDLSPLSHLTELRYIGGASNQISDISPLSGLVNLEQLDLGENNISNLSALSNMISLYYLTLRSNPISDLSPISGLTSLNMLDLSNANLSDISALSSLVNLYYLGISSNQISNVTPLVMNLGIGSGDYISAYDNLFYCDEQSDNFNALLNRGAWIDYNCLECYNGEQQCSGTFIQTCVNNAWENSQNCFDQGETCDDSSGTPQCIFVCSDGQEQCAGDVHQVCSGGDWIDDDCSVREKVCGVIAPGNGLGCAPAGCTDVLSFPDPNLESKVREYIRRPTGGIYYSNVTTLRRFTPSRAGIESIEGIQCLDEITYLSLARNPVSDFSPAYSLPKLVAFSISESTHITDLSFLYNMPQLEELGITSIDADLTPLSILTNLQRLWMHYSPATDISPLASLVNLKILTMSHNQISDISPLASMVNMEELVMFNTQVSDISPLASMTKMKKLSLQNNYITDVSPLASMVDIDQLYISGNPVSDISAFSSFNKITYLTTGGTQVADISPVSSLITLTTLYIGDSPVSNISAVSGLINLKQFSAYKSQVSDISPLVANPGIGVGDYVSVKFSKLNCSDPVTLGYIATLRARGATIYTDCD